MLTKNKKFTLVHGVAGNEFARRLKKRNPKDVIVLEGRPNLIPANKTCKSLLKCHITPTLISDNMAGFLFYKKLVKEVWLACYFDSAKGALCPIGGLILSVLARRHKIPVYLFQTNEKTNFFGHSNELCCFKNRRIAPAGTKCYVPLVEWIPSKYIKKVRNG